MKTFILSLSLLLPVIMVVAQDAHRIPLNRTLQVEVPLEYTFKAGIESVRKTVTVRLEIKDFMVLHKPLKQFIEGGAMGIMYDEVNVTRWYSYTSPDGLYVDNVFIPFSSFLDDPASASFQVQNVRFVWTQGSSRYAKFDMGSPYLNIAPKSKTPDYAFDIYNLSQIVGTETGKEAFDIVKGKGEIVGVFLQADGISYRPPYKLERYLSERDAQIAQETGYYTTNGFRNQVKKNDATQPSEQEKINNQPQTNGTSSGVDRNDEMLADEEGNNQGGDLINKRTDGESVPNSVENKAKLEAEAARKARDEAERQAKLDQAKKDLSYAAGGLAEGVMKGSLNVGIRFRNYDQDYKEFYLDRAIGVEFASIRGNSIGTKNRKLPFGGYSHFDFLSADQEGYADAWSLGIKFGVGIFKLVEVMPTVGIQYMNINGFEFNSAADQIKVDDQLFPFSVGVMGKVFILFYTIDYDLTLKSTSFGFGIHIGDGN